MSTRYYIHGDRMDDGRTYCASCDASVDDPDEHFSVESHCGNGDRIMRRIGSTTGEFKLLARMDYFRPDNAENHFFF